MSPTTKELECVTWSGGAGFIGSRLADELLGRGHQVHVLDDLSTGSIDNVCHLVSRRKFGHTIDSAANASLVAELVDEVDAVYHLAAAVGLELIVDSPVRTIETNVHCTEVVLAQANKEEDAGLHRLDERGLREG